MRYIYEKGLALATPPKPIDELLASAHQPPVLTQPPLRKHSTF
jgi:hypothetical protein